MNIQIPGLSKTSTKIPGLSRTCANPANTIQIVSLKETSGHLKKSYLVKLQLFLTWPIFFACKLMGSKSCTQISKT